MTDPIAPAVPVGVVGAGTMGAGIAQVAAVAGHHVRVHDVDGDAARRAVTTASEHLDRLVAKGRLGPSDAAGAARRLRAVDSLDELAGCGLVIEAVAEDPAVKAALFTELERVCGPDAVLTSNTSSLSIDQVAAGLTRPQRVAGLHFFNPAPVLPLVEVVAGERTDAAVVDTLVATARAWGKTPVRAASTPGFIVNRVARPFYGEAFRLLESGALDAATIDAMLRESGGFRMGPFELADLIGHDVNLAVSRSVWEAFGRDARFTPSALQEQMVAEGRLGRKSGRGIYAGDSPRPARTSAGPREVPDSPRWQITTDDVVLRLTDGRTAAQHISAGDRTVLLVDLALGPEHGGARRVGVTAAHDAPAEHVESAVAVLRRLGHHVTLLPDIPGLVVARTVAMLAAFAADAVDTRVATADDVDTAMRLGVNYPRGPYEWGAELGWRWVTGVLDALATDDPQRYRASPGLRARAGKEAS